MASYQAVDLELNLSSVNSHASTKPKTRLILATAAVAMGVLAFASVGGSNDSRPILTLLGAKESVKTPKILTPEQQAAADAEAEEAAKEAEVKRISALPKNYLPAADYKDPCDALRDECCTDERYPILGRVDLVHFKLTGEIVFGNPKSSATIQGISRAYTAWFSDKSTVAVFEANPETYLPKWGGFDAGQFCSTGGGLSVLEANTVDLSSAQELNRALAFASIPVQNLDECDAVFNSFYGSPVNAVYNTRCVSMSHFKFAVPAGLLPSMPELAVPVPMSKLYGIQPSVPSKNKLGAGAANPFEALQIGTNPLYGASQPGGPPKPKPMSAMPQIGNDPSYGASQPSGPPKPKPMSPGLQAQVGAGFQTQNNPSATFGAPMSSNPNPYAAPQYPAASWHP